MKLAAFRHQMLSYRRAAGREAKARRDSHLALDRLHSIYRKLDAKEQTMANQVLAEWALSEDENVRFDAMALIDDFMIAKAIPALQELASRIALSNTPGEPYELIKINRIIGKLALV